MTKAAGASFRDKHQLSRSRHFSSSPWQEESPHPAPAPPNLGALCEMNNSSRSIITNKQRKISPRRKYLEIMSLSLVAPDLAPGIILYLSSQMMPDGGPRCTEGVQSEHIPSSLSPARWLCQMPNFLPIVLHGEAPISRRIKDLKTRECGRKES